MANIKPRRTLSGPFGSFRNLSGNGLQIFQATIKSRLMHVISLQVVARGLRPSMVTNPQLDYRNCLDTTCDTLPHFVGIYESCWQAEPSLRPDMKHLVESLLILLYKV